MKKTKEEFLKDLRENKKYTEDSKEITKVVENMDDVNFEKELMTYSKALQIVNQYIAANETNFGNYDANALKEYTQSNYNKQKVLKYLTLTLTNQFANQELSDKYLDYFIKEVENIIGEKNNSIENGLSKSFSKVYFRIDSYNNISNMILNFRKKYEPGFSINSYDQDLKDLNENLRNLDELNSLDEILKGDVLANKVAEDEYKLIKVELDKCKHNAQNDENLKNIDYLKGKLKSDKVTPDEIANFIQQQLEDVALRNENSLNEFIEVMAQLNTSQYSHNNILMLYIQCIRNDRTPLLACESEWAKKGYEIPSKEKNEAMQIYIPKTENEYVEKNEEGKVVRHIRTKSKKESEELEERIANGENIEKRTWTSFFPKDVIYSIDQVVDAKTKKPIEEKDKPAHIQRFNSKAQITEDQLPLVEKLEKLATKLGLNLKTEKMGSALGYVSSDEIGKEFNTLAINKDIEDKEKKIWTLTHEIGHHLCKHWERGVGRSTSIPKEYQLSKQDREVQAQLISHLVATHYGIKGNVSFSSSYINAYGGDFDNPEAKNKFYGNVRIVLPISQGIVELIDNSGTEIDNESFKKLTNIPVDYLTVDKKTGNAKVVSESIVNKIISQQQKGKQAERVAE